MHAVVFSDSKWSKRFMRFLKIMHTLVVTNPKHLSIILRHIMHSAQFWAMKSIQILQFFEVKCLE